MDFKEALKDPKKIIFSLGMKGKLGFITDEKYLKLMYWANTGKKLNLENPVTFNEKLQWLKLHNQNPEYSKMVDKYEAKNWITEKIGDEFIIPTLGVWDTFDEIDFDKLPNQFVLKCTHDSGGLVICKDKNNEILYPVGKIHEDTFTTYKLLYYAEKIVYVNYVGYFYRQRENSIMSSTFNMKNLSIVEATREACDFFSNNGEKYLFDCAVNSHFKTYISTFSEVLKNKNRIDEYKQVKNDLLFQYHEDIKHYLDSSDIGAGHKLFYRLFEKAPVLVVEINRIFLNR